MIASIIGFIVIYLLIGVLPLAFIIGGLIMDKEPSFELFIVFAFLWPLFVGKLLIRGFVNLRRIPTGFAYLFSKTTRMLREL